MDLFNKRLIQEYIEKNIYTVSDKGSLYTEIIEKIINFLNRDADKTKEKSIQSLFLQRIFEQILGYPSQLSGEKKYNLLIEPTTDFDSTEADGALGFFETDLKKVKAVIELKPSNIDLDKKQTNRKDNKSPVEQAFSYSYKFDGCKWVIVSNFKEIRLYNSERGINFYQKFSVFDLLDENEFRKFCFIFNKSNFLSLTEESLIEKLAKETNIREENITKEFYQKYKETRNKLFKYISQDNPQIAKNIVLEKTQKIIDRIIFISFCEDLGLLPYNILRNILKLADDSYDISEYKLWNQLKGLFHSINIGNENKNINKFNGGLFTDDAILDSLNIKDEILKELIKISDYDFESELNVNILGHIFEQSISDIEEMKAGINELETAKKEGKRKKEGIYYTPEYITKYIVEQAVGGWLQDKKATLGFNNLPELLEEDYKSIKIAKGKVKANPKIEAHIKFWESYREILQNMKVLDPACGSGAFLIQAFDYLYKEGQLVNDELAKLKKGQRQIFDLDKHILTNNIYGVDLNEESVEITKLSLWLKTANKGKELTALDENIRCGNSLIDDPNIASKKAFNWNEIFKEIMSSGGFDVVIGNPPYIRVQNLLHKEVDYFKEKKLTAFKRIDISILFFELAHTILKKNGYVSFITSNQFLSTEYGEKIRKFILDYFRITEITDFGDLSIFQNALTYVSIFTLKKAKGEDFQYKKIDNLLNIYFSLYNTNTTEIELNTLSKSPWVLQSYTNTTLIKKLEKNLTLNDYDSHAWGGIITGVDDILMIDEHKIKKEGFEKEIILPIIRSSDPKKYYLSPPTKYVIYPYKFINGNTKLIDEKTLEKSYPIVYRYLSKNKETLLKRRDSRRTFEGKDNWYGLVRFGRLNIFEKIKIVTPGEVKEHKFAIDNTKSGYSFARVYAITVNDIKIDIYYVLAILNSKLIRFYLQSFAPSKQGGYYTYSSTILNKVPIVKTNEAIQKAIISNVKNLISFNKNLNEMLSTYLEILKVEFKNIKINKKIESFKKLNFIEFIDEIEKQKIQIQIEQKEKLYNWFKAKVGLIQDLENKIKNMDDEINELIYRIYNLTEDEIKIVEDMDF
ncbi:MAG: N-6 DNA methylase [Cyanobacteria bacterium]|nr:N-6 DNA methylase [Cyanobacteriota bacterium]